MSLRLKTQALTYFLKSGFHLPAPHKPGDYLFRIGIEIGAQQSLGSELFLQVADQEPTQGHGGKSRAVPDGGIRDDLNRTFCATIPVGYRDRRPESGGIFGNYREVGQTLTFEAGPSYLLGVVSWSRLVESSVQAQAGNEGDRISQLAAAV